MIPEEIEEYALFHTSEQDPLLHELYRETNLKTLYPRMLSGPLQGKLLEMISRMIGPANVLEIGTFTGYSAICLARGLRPGGLLTTIEVDPELADFAGRYFRKAGLTGSIRQHIGKAMDILPQLNYPWDLVFIDADKESYVDYYDMVIGQMASGGYILADNVLWDGKVLEDPGRQDRETKGIVAFNAKVRKDDRADQLLLPVRDGLMIIRKK